MNVYWLEQTASDLPAHTDWLNPSDAARIDGMRFAKRRNDWLLGRWTAKQAVAACMHLASDSQTLANIELRPEPSGAPEVYFAGSLAGVSISLSHSSGVAVCAVAEAGGVIGCDLEAVEPRSDAFVLDYFTTAEVAQVAETDEANRPRLIALIWSAKESALKALRTGLRQDTRSVTVTLADALRDPSRLPPQDDLDTWHPLRACCSTGEVFEGWWQHSGGLVRTVVAASPAPPPIRLKRLS
jgi:4'-phosphopantetheinyl transferase